MYMHMHMYRYVARTSDQPLVLPTVVTLTLTLVLLINFAPKERKQIEENTKETKNLQGHQSPGTAETERNPRHRIS